MSVAVVLANLLVDVVYPLVDPRVRLTGKGDAIAASRGLRRELRAQRRGARGGRPAGAGDGRVSA